MPWPIRFGPGAEDDDARRGALRRRLVRFVPGRVVVRRLGRDLARARVDAAVDRRAGALLLALALDVRRARARTTGGGSPGSSRAAASRPRSALTNASRKVRPMPIVSPTDFICVPSRRVGARELLEREARDLHDDVVERRLEARRRRLRQVVRDLVERVADRELRRDLRDRVARRLRRERRGARDARVHLDHADLPRLAVARELDVRAAALDADGADDRDRRVAQLLVGLVGERHLRRDRDRVAGVHAHRVEVLDRADDHDVVERGRARPRARTRPSRAPTPRRAPGRSGSRAGRARPARSSSSSRLGEAAAVAAERERGPHDRRRRGSRAARPSSSRSVDLGTRRPVDSTHALEELAVLGAVDHVRAARRSARRRARRGGPTARARARG